MKRVSRCGEGWTRDITMVQMKLRLLRQRNEMSRAQGPVVRTPFYLGVALLRALLVTFVDVFPRD